MARSEWSRSHFLGKYFDRVEHQATIAEWNEQNPKSTAARASPPQVHCQISIPGEDVRYEWADPPVPGMLRNNAELHVRMEAQALNDDQNIIWIPITPGFTCPALNATDSMLLNASQKDRAAEEEGGGLGSTDSQMRLET